MFLRMSDEKQSTSEPTVVFSTSEASGAKLKSRLTKKHVLIAIVSLLITGLVVTAVLVGIRIFTDSNLEVLKYTMKANGISQNVSTSENSVIFHVTRDNLDAWIVQNFDTGLQVTKVLADGKTTCYVTALNRSVAAEPSAIPSTAPADNADSQSNGAVYEVLPDPVPDLAFLGKKASTMCQNIPTYHAVPDCGKAAKNDASSLQNTTSIADHRGKRTPQPGCARYNGQYCSCGCCAVVCGQFTSWTIIYWRDSYGWHCTFFVLRPYTIFSLYPSCTFAGRYYLP